MGTRETSGLMKQGKGTSASTPHTQMLSAWETKKEGLELHVQLQHYSSIAMAEVVGEPAQLE